MIFNDKSKKVSDSISYSEKKQIDAKLKTLSEAVEALQDTTTEHGETLENITSGNGETVIPIGAGGTGQTDAVSDRNALLGNIPEEVDAVTDDTLIAGVYPDTDITSGKLSKRKMSLLWNYFKQKVALENIGTGSDIARSDADPTTIAETFNNVDSVLEKVQQEIEDGVTSETVKSFTFNNVTYKIGASLQGGVYTPTVYNSLGDSWYIVYILTLTGWESYNTRGSVTLKGLSEVLALVVADCFVEYKSRGVANGIATLDANGKLPTSQMPTNSRQIVGEIDTSTVHTLPDVSGYSNGNELIVTGAGYYNTSTAFTLAAGKTLTDMEVAQANKLIAAGYTFTLTSEGETLGTVSTFAKDSVTLTDETVISLPYASALSATSDPSTVQVSTKVGDEIMVIDGHWIHLSSDSAVDSVNGKTGAVVLSASDVSAVSTEAVETTLSESSDKIPASSAVNTALTDYYNEQSATDAKTITLNKTLSKGSTIRVLFVNGHNGSSLTLNGYAVKVNKNGSLIDIPTHVIDSTEKCIQPYTTLELMYDSTQFVVIGNPTVLSYSNQNDTVDAIGYEIKADGLITLKGHITLYTGQTTTISFPTQFSNTNYFVFASEDCGTASPMSMSSHKSATVVFQTKTESSMQALHYEYYINTSGFNWMAIGY